ncbi:MAG: hypothetical protein ACRDV0_04035 [Acidimicrobiales bacterium]
MEFARLDATLATRDAWAADLASSTRPVALRLLDGDAMVAAAASDGAVRSVWVVASDQYPAAIIARDVKTLAALVDLGDVVVEGADAPAHAEVVAALLSDDEVSFANDVATISHAYNRPAPARPVAVWSFDGVALRHGDASLRVTSTVPVPSGTLTLFT